MRTSFKPFVLSFLLAGGLAFWSGCDQLADSFGLNSVAVDPGAAGEVRIAPQSTSFATATVEVGRDLPSNLDVDNIKLPEGAVRFVPAAGARAAAAADTFDVDFWLLIDSVVAVQGQARVAPRAEKPLVGYAYAFANSYDPAAICGLLPEGTACPLTSETPTRQQIRDAVDAAITSGRFAVSLVVYNQGEVAGTFYIDTLEFDLGF